MKNFNLLNAMGAAGFALVLTTAHAQAVAQEMKPPPSELFQTIAALDAKVFDAYNRCDNTDNLKVFGDYFTPDVEFYHDNGGLMASRKAVVASTQKYICGKVRRELIPGTLEVYPIKDYGAIETGEHRFCKIESADTCEGAAKFAMVWQRKGGVWKMSRVLSFGHRTLPTAAPALDTAGIQKILTENKVPAVGVGIIRDGKLARMDVIGELTKGVAAPPNTIFNVASLAKPIVTMLTLKLVSQGEWKLDEPLANYWVDPDVANDPRSKQLTTRHVLSHQSGFVNWRWLHASKKLAFDVDPGTKFQYSGEGFNYLQRALENKFSMPLEQLVDAVVFKPLAMNDSRFVWDLGMDGARFAVEHDESGKPYPAEKRMKAIAADDLLTTVADYAKFGVSVLNQTGLTQEVAEAMRTPQAAMKGSASMGLGWELHRNLGQQKEYALIHSGSDQGVRTVMILLPQSKQGLIIFTNGDNGSKLYEKLVTESLDLGGEIWKRATE